MKGKLKDKGRRTKHMLEFEGQSQTYELKYKIRRTKYKLNLDPETRTPKRGPRNPKPYCLTIFAASEFFPEITRMM